MAFGDLKGTLTVNAASITNPTSAVGSVVVVVGDLVFAVLAEQTTLTVTACADNLGNSYTAVNAGTDPGISTSRAFFSRVTVAGTLTSVNFTATASADDVAAIAAVISGPFLASPLDANPANNNNTDNATPFTCPATGTMAQINEVVCCWMSWTGNSATFLATSPNLKALQATSSTNIGVIIGYQKVTSTSTISPAFTGTNPTDSVQGTVSFKADILHEMLDNFSKEITPSYNRLKSSARAGLVIASGFAPIGFAPMPPPTSSLPWFESTLLQPFQINRVSDRYASIKRKSEFAYFSPFVPLGFEQVGETFQPPQPPKTRTQAASFLPAGSEIFIAGALQTAANSWFETPRVDPRIAWERRGGGLKQTISFGYNDAFVPWGYDQQSLQPPVVRVKKSGAIFEGIDGTDLPLVVQATITWGYDQQSFQIPVGIKKYGAFFEGADGTDSPFVQWRNAGWEVQSVQPPQTKQKRWAAFAPVSNIEVVYQRFASIGFDLQAFQPPHPRPERFGAVVPHEDGIERPYERWINSGWEIAPTQLRNTKLALRGTLAWQTELFYSVTLQTADFRWFETPLVYPRKWSRGTGALKQTINFGYFTEFKNYPWSVPDQYKKRRPPVTDNIPEIFTSLVTTLQTSAYPWYESNVQAYSKKTNKAFGLIGRITIGFFVEYPAYAWEAPPHYNTRRKVPSLVANELHIVAGLQTVSYPWQESPWVYPRKHFAKWAALAPKEDGTEYPFLRWFNDGWEIQSWQPPHRWVEKRGAIMPREEGIENTKPIGLQTGDYAWQESPWVYPRKNFAKWASVAPKEDGTEYPYLRWFNIGWEIQPPQPPHPRREKAGSILEGIDGIDAQFVPPFTFIAWGYDPTLVHQRRVKLGAIFAIGDSGTQDKYIRWLNAGWEIQSWQPPHRAPERKASAFFEGDDGNQSTYLQWINAGWEIQAWQPPSHRYAVAGAIIVPVFIDNILGPVFVPPPEFPPRRRSKRLVSLFYQTERNVGVNDIRSNRQNRNTRRTEDVDPSR